jgi:hypothetical protein
MALDDPKNRGLLWRALFTPRQRTSGRGTIIWLLCMAAIAAAFAWTATR